MPEDPTKNTIDFLSLEWSEQCLTVKTKTITLSDMVLNVGTISNNDFTMGAGKGKKRRWILTLSLHQTGKIMILVVHDKLCL